LRYLEWGIVGLWSRRDQVKVAWHEMPGIMSPQRSVPEGRHDEASLAEQRYAYLTRRLMRRFERVILENITLIFVVLIFWNLD
jgi:hypothetical protein